MRLLASADWHLGLKRYGSPGPDGISSRVHDFEATLARFVDVAVHENVDLAVFAGDTFNTRHEGYHERAAFTAAVRRLRATGITVLIIPGNHDGRSTVGGAESDSLRWFAEIEQEGIHVFLAPTATIVQTGTGRVAVVTMPYPHRRTFDGAENMDAVEPSERVLMAGSAIERQIRELQQKTLGWKGPSLFVGHLTVADSIAGSETAMKMGWDVAIRRETLKPFSLAVLGHIHRFQRLSKVNAWYCGSPEYVDFTEAGLDKGFLLADFGTEEEPNVRLVPSDARPMVDIPVLIHEGKAQIGAVKVDWQRGPIVRLLIRTAARPDPDALAKIERAMTERGASFVKTKLLLPEGSAVDRREAATDAPDPELDPMEATRRFLTDASFPKVDAAMEAARKLAAVGAGD